MSANVADPPPPTPRLSGDFWRFWVGQTISNLGSAFTSFAVPLLIFQLTGSALNLAFASAATSLPGLLFGLLIGAWVDRVDRKRLMIRADIARAVVIASIPLLALWNWLPIWQKRDNESDPGGVCRTQFVHRVPYVPSVR